MVKIITLHGHNYKVMSKSKAQSAYRAFLRSDKATLDDAYGRYSKAKANAYAYCRAREDEFGSYDGVITGANTCQFSYAFTGICEGKKYFVYITKSYDYVIALEDF